MGGQVERLVHAEHERRGRGSVQGQLQAHGLDGGTEVAEPTGGFAEGAVAFGRPQPGPDHAGALDRTVDRVGQGRDPVGLDRATGTRSWSVPPAVASAWRSVSTMCCQPPSR